MPLCAKIAKRSGQKVLHALGEMGLIHNAYKVASENATLLLPLVAMPSAVQQARLKALEPALMLIEAEVPASAKTPTVLGILSESLPPHLLSSVPRSIDHIGDIVVIELPVELWPHRDVVGNAILAIEKRTRTVLAKSGPVSGTFRVRDYEVIAGEDKTTTVHRENGCLFHLDLSKVYFTPRLSHEHERVATLARQGETVIDLFSGVGPYAIQVAKRLSEVKVYAVDLNPAAVQYLNRNILLNKVWDRVTAIEGDAREVVRAKLVGVADRVIMNLPSQATAFLDAACMALKAEGGVIHHYAFAAQDESRERLQVAATEAIRLAGRAVASIVATRTVRPVAPREYLTAMDLRVI